MSILVTGGAGFIGSHIIDSLIESNLDVISVDNYSAVNSGYVNKAAKYINADILSNSIENVFQNHSIDYCIHLAAQASVNNAIKDPINDAYINILGSLNIIKLCKKYGCKKIIAASSAAVYGNPQELPIQESHTTEPLSQYGLSKITMEKYIQLSGIPYIICRFSNVYGERQTSHGEAGVVSIFDYAMKKNNQVYIDGDGMQYRDFIYVRDVADIINKIIKSHVNNEIINISTGNTCSINQLFQYMKTIYHYDYRPIYRDERKGDIRHSVLDNSKICSILKSYSYTNIEDGIENLYKFSTQGGRAIV